MEFLTDYTSMIQLTLGGLEGMVSELNITMMPRSITISFPEISNPFYIHTIKLMHYVTTLAPLLTFGYKAALALRVQTAHRLKHLSLT